MIYPLGHQGNPYNIAPMGWDDAGCPYGAFCKCHRCGLVERSTFTFDYYADKAGDPLVCGTCKEIDSHEAAKIVNARTEFDVN